MQAILLGGEEEAQDVRARLGAGEDFATLDEELSQHTATKENGGDLGWLSRYKMSFVFDEFAFNPELELETLSEPIRDETVTTGGGYWLLKVLDKEDSKQISDDDRSFLKTKALDEWVFSLWDDPGNEVNNYLTDEMRDWAIARATEG